MKQHKGLLRLLSLLLIAVLLVGLLPTVLADGGEPDWAISGKALQIATNGDIRVKLTEFEDLADGSYELTLKVPENDGNKVPGNVGILARYAGEDKYAGLSLDLNAAGSGTNWTAHYSKGIKARGNDVVAEGPALTAGTELRIRVTYAGDKLSFAYMTAEHEDFVAVVDEKAMSGSFSTEAGGLALRISAGNTGCSTILVDNIVQYNASGAVVKTVDFDGAVTVAYEARANKDNTLVNDKATLTVVNADGSLPEVDPDEMLAAAKTTVESASFAAVSAETVTTAEGAQAAVEAVLNGLTLGDGVTYAVDGEFTAAVNGTKDDPNGTDGTYVFTVTLSLAGADDVTTDEQTLTVTALPYEAPDLSVDPGLPPVVPESGDDTYTQNLQDASSFTGGVAANINQEYWGMSGYAVTMASGDDYRVEFEYFDEMADGAYEISFRLGDAVPSTLGFLARYADESQYAGMSIDSAGATWAGHYSTGLTTRSNPGLAYDLELSANTTYQVRLEYSGANVTIKAKWDGEGGRDEWFTMGSYTISGGYTGEGKFAIRLRGGTGVPVTFDNIKQYNADGELVKTLDFDDQPALDLVTRVNRNNAEVSDVTTHSYTEIPASETVSGFTPGRGTKITASAAGVFVDQASPATDAPTYTVQLAASTAKFGLVFNYQDANNYAAIWYDGSKWVAGGMKNGSAVASIDLSSYNIPTPAANAARTYRLDKTGDTYTLTVSAGAGAEDAGPTVCTLGALDGIFTGKGKVGVYLAEAGTLYAGPVEVVYELTATVLPDPTEYITLQSDEMQVLVGKSFPYVYSYKDLSGKVLAYGTLVGSEESRIYVDTAANLYDATENTNNWVLCGTTSKLVKNDETSATYEITATNADSNIEAVFTVVLTVDGSTLKMSIPSVEEAAGSATVRAFQFGGNPVLTLAGLGAGGALAVHSGWGPMRDDFVALKGASKDATYSNFTYGMFYDTASGVSASVENNAENGNQKYILTQKVTGTPYLSLSSAAWAWEYYDGFLPEEDEIPYISVVIGGDENADGAITWQDAGIAYRDIMRLPYGYENTKNEWMFIAMNMSSQASQPFLRVLDQAKALSYLTDGFGMKIMNKGYQVSGHDDSHGDYDFAGLQQGGADEFNTLIDVGLEYGIKNGVHANATEFALDGFDTVLENMRGIVTGSSLVKNWNWFDQAYLVDKNKDVWSGALKERIQEFDEALPNLDFVYLDVYQAGSRYKATQLVKYFNDVGITMGTEALEDLNQMITFVHWNTDMYYATGGTQSEVMKFVSHGVGDLAAPDKAILGSLMPGVADWRNTNRFSDGVDVFYRNNLPTKYLQHFELLSWTPSEKAVFSDNVVSTVDGNYTTITKDGKTIAVIDTSTVLAYADINGQTPMSPKSAEIFIPWSPETEDKIYCYSDTGSFGTWEVPNSWSGVTTAYLYELTTTGRTLVDTVAVTGGKVTLDLEQGVPYVMTKTQEAVAHRYDVDGFVLTENGKTVYLPTLEEHPYGEGTLFKDPGFTSLSIEPWTVTGENTDQAVVAQDQYEQAMLWLKPGFAGSVGQTVTVEPGKTYSLSVWVNSAGDRPVTLTAAAGDVTETATVKTTADHTVMIKPSKFTGMTYTRLKVDITIPAGVTTATVALSTVAGTNEIYADDFRSWEWTDLTGDPNPGPSAERENYYYYEDFEHLDENWGPFVSNVNNQPFVNLAYYDFGGNQIKTYVVDASETNRTSLKGQQNGSFGTVGGDGGVIMRTEPATLNFETGYEYTVEFDYQLYMEYQTTAQGAPGKNGPLDETLSYYIDVRKADGTRIATYELEPNQFDEAYLEKYVYAEGAANNTDPDSYDVHPETLTMRFPVDATTEKDIFLTFRVEAPSGFSANAVFAIDNFRVTRLGEEPEPDTYTIAVTQAEGGTIDPASAEVEKGDDVTFTFTAAEGYELTDVVVDGESVGVQNPYTFTNVTADHTITAVFTEKIVESELEEIAEALESRTYSVSQSKVNTGAAAGAHMQTRIDGLLPEGVTGTIHSVSFTAAKAGTLLKPKGTDGAYVFTVTLNDGTSTYTTEEITLVIEATEYKLPVQPTRPGGGSGTTDKPAVQTEFYDVATTAWYYDAVMYVCENGYMNGVAEGQFNPDGAVTRAMVWTVLARMDGENTEGGSTWYAKAQAWAMETGVSDGTDPNGAITREQLATMLYRYIGSPVVSGSLSGYPDAGSVSDWAENALVWATQTGLVNGINGNLSPKTGATRAQLATMLMRLMES
ncbi:MAG TPA: S-layer homology domain-containing protein [Candidatus Avoscillospira stercorigallinarum]|uniref:S-layer homology domain-containing protein n=1 Tax=Candidatus Avoscillospira stercorigallinarum TaxID=2840708 RepID=A0A9D0Z7U0_9FIRM|nr:S-layer homology domain-containing protein [Candidatus Avoscillospira stercorigallinarum]